MAYTGQVLVTPEQLESTSNEFSSIGQQVATSTQQMLDIVKNMGATWQGEASTAYLTKFNNHNEDIQQIKRMIDEHVADLQQMAGIYRKAEQTNQELSNSLANDVVS